MHDLPPRAAVYQRPQRWLAADSFADVACGLRAVIFNGRTLRFSPESGEQAGSDGASASGA